MDGPAIAELMADVAAAVSRRAAVVSEDVYEVILREIPELHDDKAVLALLASSVHSNVSTCLQVMQHRIDLSAVQAPAAAVEYARRKAQRGTPLTALLRAYRLGHTCFSDWLFKELARQSDDAQTITAATLSMSKIVAGYVDQTSEEIVTAYTRERESWLRNRSAARAARVRDLLSGRRVNVSTTEATWGPGRRRRAPCSAARDPADLPADRGQLQDDGRTADAAQEHCPAPGPQGRGKPRPAGGREPA